MKRRRNLHLGRQDVIAFRRFPSYFSMSRPKCSLTCATFASSLSLHRENERPCVRDYRSGKGRWSETKRERVRRIKRKNMKQRAWMSQKAEKNVSITNLLAARSSRSLSLSPIFTQKHWAYWNWCDDVVTDWFSFFQSVNQKGESLFGGSSPN